MSMPAVCRNSSPVKCWVAPKPGLANETLPGLTLADAISALTSLGGHHAERVAVLVGAGDRLVAERAGGARPVLDHDRLAELFLQRLCDDAADDVGAAAGSEWHDDADRPLRPFLRRCFERAGQHCGGGGSKQPASRQHRCPPCVQGSKSIGHAAIAQGVAGLFVVLVSSSARDGYPAASCRTDTGTALRRARSIISVGR
jgi:hypothetical protein